MLYLKKFGKFLCSTISGTLNQPQLFFITKLVEEIMFPFPDSLAMPCNPRPFMLFRGCCLKKQVKADLIIRNTASQLVKTVNASQNGGMLFRGS